jgi:uncharacterized phage protein (TIGR01671 family)
MGEIKFIAWDGIRITSSGIMFNSSTYTLEVPEGSRMKLMQYTGLKDKDGKEIYEGDILARTSIADAIVIFEDGAFCRKKISTSTTALLSLYIDEFTVVIGNIYENPELITP